MDGEEAQQNPESTIAAFQTLSSEGDLLLQKGCFHEAIDVYTKALALRPTDKHCLVCRSRCYIQIGSPRLALADAEASLKEKPDFFKGIYQKAEALYAEGDFELALMYYHRGNRLRPELSEFRIGIQKSREAIDNSIGDPKAMKIKVPQKLRRHLNAILTTQANNPSPNDTAGKGNQGGSGAKGAQKTIPSNSNRTYDTTIGHLTPSMELRLLGELYEDKVYLQDLLQDRDFNEYPDEEIAELVSEGLRYLDTRLDFWRQQHPLYARPHKTATSKTAAGKDHPHPKPSQQANTTRK